MGGGRWDFEGMMLSRSEAADTLVADPERHGEERELEDQGMQAPWGLPCLKAYFKISPCSPRASCRVLASATCCQRRGFLLARAEGHTPCHLGARQGHLQGHHRDEGAGEGRWIRLIWSSILASSLPVVGPWADP